MCVRSRLRLGLVVVGAVLLTLSLVPTAAASGAGGSGGAHASTTVDTDESSAVTVTKSLSAANGKTTLSGTVQYRGVDGNLQPARQVTVKIRHDVVGPVNPVIARTTTDDQGRYSVQIDVAEYEADVDFDKKLFLHVQAVAKNPAVNVVNFGQNLDTANGNTWTLNQEAMVKRGQNSATVDLTATKEKPRRAFQVANWTLEAYRFTEREAGWTRNRVKARYPAANPNNSQFKSPFEKFVIGSNGWDADKRHTVHHEYGHAVMSGLFKYKGWQIPKPANWGPHCVWSDTGRITAWYEGFAAFFEAAVNDSPRTDGMWLEQHHYYNETNEHGPQCPESHANDGYDGAKVEGAVANVLWDLYDPADEPHDNVDGDLGTIFDAVNETDNQQRAKRPFNSDRTTDIHDFFVQYLDNTGRHEDLRKIYFEYGIVKPDRFDSTAFDESNPFVECSVHYYPCSKQPNQHWTTLDPDESVDVLYHGGEADDYVVPLSKGERVTVTLEAGAGNTNLDYKIVKGSPPWNGNDMSHKPWPQVGSPTDNGDVVTQTFTANESGDYTVMVSDSPGGGRISAYTISVNHTTESRDGGPGYRGPDLDFDGPCDETHESCEIPDFDDFGSNNSSSGPRPDGSDDDSDDSSDPGTDESNTTGSDGSSGDDSSSTTDSGSGSSGTDADPGSDGGSGDGDSTDGTSSASANATTDSGSAAESGTGGNTTDSGSAAESGTGDDSTDSGTAADGDTDASTGSDGGSANTTATRTVTDSGAADDPGEDSSDGDGGFGVSWLALLALLLALLAVLIAVLRR
jgi:hypothetical protein